MEWYFQADDPGVALAARGSYVAFLKASCAAHSDFGGAEIIFGELVGNVFRHAEGSIEINVRRNSDGQLTLEVCDQGPAFSLAAGPCPSADQIGGRGLYLITALSPSAAVERTHRGNRVRVVLPVRLKHRSRVHRNGNYERYRIEG